MNGRFRKGLAGILAAGVLALPGCRTSGESTDLGVGSMAAGVLIGSPAAFLFGAGATVYGAGQANGNGQNVQQNNFFNSDWSLQQLRSSFSQREHIAFVADVPKENGYMATLTIFNSPNSIIRVDEIWARSAGDLGNRKVMIYPPNTFSPGTYTGVWKNNNRTYLGQSMILVTN